MFDKTSRMRRIKRNRSTQVVIHVFSRHQDLLTWRARVKKASINSSWSLFICCAPMLWCMLSTEKDIKKMPDPRKEFSSIVFKCIVILCNSRCSSAKINYSFLLRSVSLLFLHNWHSRHTFPSIRQESKSFPSFASASSHHLIARSLSFKWTWYLFLLFLSLTLSDLDELCSDVESIYDPNVTCCFPFNPIVSINFRSLRFSMFQTKVDCWSVWLRMLPFHPRLRSQKFSNKSAMNDWGRGRSHSFFE